MANFERFVTVTGGGRTWEEWRDATEPLNRRLPNGQILTISRNHKFRRKDNPDHGIRSGSR